MDGVALEREPVHHNPTEVVHSESLLPPVDPHGNHSALLRVILWDRENGLAVGGLLVNLGATLEGTEANGDFLGGHVGLLGK
jgi:hypothetical protein